MMHQSIATIDSPEFINLQPLEINPLMSSCEIKVMYVGENRNHSYITKEVATEMAKTLRGAPIVGYYKEEKQDFADHGEKIIFDDEGVKFECMTKPYGFVAPDAKVWFQKFEDMDDFGNTTTREYLMTTGYLWTGQFEECQSVVTSGKPQSMELDEENLNGHWSTDSKTGMDFFIINDAIFSKLCILGDDVEPCFEGASVTAPQVSTSFTKIDDGFKKTLYTMMQDLKFALEGGQKMEIENTESTEIVEEEIEKTEEVSDNLEQSNDNSIEAESSAEFAAEVETTFEESESDNTDEADNSDESSEESQPTEEEEKEDEPSAMALSDEENNEESEKDLDEEDEDSKNKKYELLESEYEELKSNYSSLEEKYQELVAFKGAVEAKEKEALIDSFYMLSEEDKKDVRENMSTYSLDDIESKLSVICVRKKVNFEKEESSVAEDEKPAVTYNLDNAVEESSIPAWLAAVKKHSNK